MIYWGIYTNMENYVTECHLPSYTNRHLAKEETERADPLSVVLYAKAFPVCRITRRVHNLPMQLFRPPFISVKKYNCC